jgi:hypothetical protein
MEYAQGDVAVSESVQKASDCFFIVVCRETCGPSAIAYEKLLREIYSS